MGPLQGIKVIDLSVAWAGPQASMYLGDQGADVIKVEPPWGAMEREIFTTAPIKLDEGNLNRHFLVVNRNKRGIVVDIRTEDGRNIIYKLVKISDVLIHNFRPGVAKRLMLDYRALSQINSRLVYVNLTPWGEKGPLAGWSAYDLLIQSISGILGERRLPDGTPFIPAGAWIVDDSTPMLIAYGVALALLERQKTGMGQEVITSLLSGAVAMQSVELLRTEKELSSHTEQPHAYRTGAIYAPYRCRDGRYIMLVLMTNEEWNRLCDTLGIPQMKEFDSYEKRLEHNDEIYNILESVISTKERDEWVKVMRDNDVPCAPVNDREEIFSHPQFLENRLIEKVDDPRIGKLRMFGIPVNLSQNPGQIRRVAPDFGQHTDEILTELGYSQGEIDTLRQKGVIK